MPDAIPPRPVRTLPPQMLDALRVMQPFDQASLNALRAFGENFDPETLTEIAVRPEGGFDVDSLGCRYQFQRPDGVQVEICRVGVPDSAVRINLNLGRVTKSRPKGDMWDIVEREVHWLSRMSPTVAPRLLRRPAGAVELSYEGEMVNQYNLPLDWREQAETILQGLKDANCAHNDIHVPNLMVANGRIKLIDYGWATEIGEPIPDIWPEAIGQHHRLGVHQFDDRHAIFTALGIIERLAMGEEP